MFVMLKTSSKWDSDFVKFWSILSSSTVSFFFQVYSFCSTTNSNASVGNGLSDIAVHLDPEDVDHLISKILTCNRDFIKFGVCSNLGSLNCACNRKKGSTWGPIILWLQVEKYIRGSPYLNWTHDCSSVITNMHLLWYYMEDSSS